MLYICVIHLKFKKNPDLSVSVSISAYSSFVHCLMTYKMENSEMDSLFGTSKDEKERNSYETFKGILAAFAWVPLLVTSAASVQLLERQIPDFELNALRFGTAGILFAIGVIVLTRQCPVIPISEITSVMGFVTFTMGSTVSIYSAVNYIPVASVHSIYLTSSIVSGVILYAVFLKEKVTLKIVLFATLCCFGVVLVIQPGFIFSMITNKSRENISESVANSEDDCKSANYCVEVISFERKWNDRWGLLGIGISTLAGLCTSLNVLLIKKLTFLQEHVVETLLWTYSICAVLSSIVMAIFEKPALPETGLQYLYVTLHCVTYVFGWPLYMYAARFISGSTIHMIVSTSVVFMLVPQYTILPTIFSGNKNWIEVVGVFLVLLGSISKSLAEVMCDKSK